MLITTAILGAMLAVAWALLRRREPEAIRPALLAASGEIGKIAWRIPFALLFAAFVAALLPADLVLATVGGGTGLVGVLVASAVGAVLPGGPFVAFPIAVGLAERGAGTAQLVALVTAWSVLAVQRAVVFELPLMGWRFTTIRLAASLSLPILAGAAVLLVRG
jgi:uncharacterized membrane protein YraQ (UPF0718 family)